MLCLRAWGGSAGSAKAEAVGAEMFSREDMDGAIKAAKSYFRAEFSGCTLTERAYAGDEERDFAYPANVYGGDGAIVLTSSFGVDSWG